MQEQYGFSKDEKRILAARRKAREKVLNDLNNVKATYGVDVDNPFKAIKLKYEFKLYYLGQLVFMMDTKPYNMTLDEYWESLKEEERKNSIWEEK